MKAKGKKKVTAGAKSRFVREGLRHRQGLNPAFMANAKKEKDAVQGWAFDFSNPDAGQG